MIYMPKLLPKVCKIASNPFINCLKLINTFIDPTEI